MNRSELVSAIINDNAKSGNKISKKDATDVVNSALSIIKDQVSQDNKVTIFDFGTFSRAERAERNGVNPSTKEPLFIPAKSVAKFKPSKTFLN